MKAEDVIKQLQIFLPFFTDRFTDRLDITSLTRSGTTVTATTVQNLSIFLPALGGGDVAHIKGAEAPIQVSSITRVDTIATITTVQDHDVTKNLKEDFIPKIRIQGANESEWNDTFDVTRPPPNRNTIEIVVPDTFTTPATGTILLFDGKERGFNGLKTITKIGPNSFTYELPATQTPLSPAIGTSFASVNLRMSGAVEFGRALSAYTQLTQNFDTSDDKYWLFVVLGNNAASKDRNVPSDATASIGKGDEFRQRILSNMQLFVFAPTIDDFAGARGVRDDMINIRAAIFRAVLNQKFATGLCETPFATLTYLNDNLFMDDTAFIVHQFSFETVFDITQGDTLDDFEDVAFRDIILDLAPDLPNTDFTAAINLDDNP